MCVQFHFRSFFSAYVTDCKPNKAIIHLLHSVTIFNTDGSIRGPDKYAIYQTETVLIEYHGIYS